MTTKLLAAVLLTLPLFAEPMFDLYDCKGRERVCGSLFPGEAAPWQTSELIVGDRIVVNGVDLGPRWTGYSTVPTYIPIYYRDPYVIAWAVHTFDYDTDGYMVRWRLGGEAERLSDNIRVDYISGANPNMVDVNSKGVVIGNGAGPGNLPYYDNAYLGLYFIEDADSKPVWAPRLVDFESSQLLRINDAGQALGYTAFRIPPSDDGIWWENRLFLLSPKESDVPRALHTPEPSSILYICSGLALIIIAVRVYRKR